MKTRKLHAWGALAIAVSAGMVLTGAMGPILGAEVEVTNEGGGGTNGEPGSSIETSFNPTHSCSVSSENGSMRDWLGCVAYWIDPTFLCLQQTPGEGNVGWPYPPELIDPNECPEVNSRTDFSVTYKRRINPDGSKELLGLLIHRWHADESGSTEPVHLRVTETSLNVKRTKVVLDRSNLAARITLRTLPTFSPSGGSIQVILNDRTVSTLTTSAGQTIGTISRALFFRIQAAGFTAHQEGNTIVVDNDGGLSIRNVTLKCTDAGIAESELELLYTPPPQED